MENPERQEQSKRSRKKYIKNLKEGIIRGSYLSTSTPTYKLLCMGSSAPSNFSSANDFATMPSDTYIYGAGIIAVLAIGACL